ncbi:iron chelate uptake ABC transporter family permease subunit [Breoghania sp.]|uniref:iron chelate uptake ABC transporter family permease subunit n=1 Tax=Breoghania sp. TaxID=2065378 RepID=UPI002621DB03|nr:iron chelate uptake ABC transporter family permease subunit [Breoghania sp.]MDJ0930601.1 iron chelate uptake ABC transporter family permease subunit [Breoghania sp.]
MIIALVMGTLATALALFNEHQLSGLFVWGSGSLVQRDWSASRQILLTLFLATAALALLRRPFVLLGLGEGAGALGLSVARTRLACIVLAVMLTGVIGFIGLAASALARGLGIRRPVVIALAAMSLGALLLSTTDSALQIVRHLGGVHSPDRSRDRASRCTAARPAGARSAHAA